MLGCMYLCITTCHVLVYMQKRMFGGDEEGKTKGDWERKEGIKKEESRKPRETTNRT